MTHQPLGSAAGAATGTVVIVVNYRTPTLVVAMLESLLESDSMPRGVVVIDNASGDESPAVLSRFVKARGLSSLVRVECLARNVGFAGGNNAGIRHARRAWPAIRSYFLLNPDTVVRPDTISALEGFLDRTPQAGIAGSQLEDHTGSLACSAHVGDGIAWQFVGASQLRIAERMVSSLYRRIVGPMAPCRCDWVSGAALMIREATLMQTGLLDDRFFLYFEEVDLCRRARRQGWQVWLVPGSRVVHYEGSSTGIAQGRRPRYWFASRRRFLLKHRGPVGLLAADAAWAIGRSGRFLVDLALRRRVPRFPPKMGRDLLLGDLLALAKGDVSGL